MSRQCWILITAIFLVAFSACGTLDAALLYWDTTGGTASPASAPTGNWDGVTANWNTDPTGYTQCLDLSIGIR